MGTVIDRVDVAHARWRDRHSALHLAVTAATDCLRRAGCDAHELDLVVNAGIYRDRNLGEPALAALIQDDIGANPEDPHTGGHGTFSFDVANGACGVLTALQIVDGFLRTHSIRARTHRGQRRRPRPRDERALSVFGRRSRLAVRMVR